MNILCCLLSDQHVPNLLSVHHFRPDHLVLIESTAMQKGGVSENFLAALDAGGLQYAKDEQCDVVPLANISDFQAIGMALRQAFGKHPTADWTVNLTGGTKPMSIAAYEFFKAVGARLIYVEVSKPNQIIDVESGAIETADYRLSIAEFLLGYGFKQRKSPKKISAAEDRARSWFEAARAIARAASNEELLHLDRDHWNLGRNQGLELASGELSISSEALRNTLSETFNLSLSPSGSLVGSIDKYATQFLTGGWLEAFLWGILDRHSTQLGIWDVRLGILPARGDVQTDNDLDIAFMRDYALNTIECKSGSQEHDPKLDVLYKVEAITRQYRALRVRSFLATTAQAIFDKQGNLKQNLQDRAAIYGCRFLTKSVIEELARNPDDPQRVNQLVFGEK